MTLDRRLFLKAGGAALFSAGLGPSFLQRAALAMTEPEPFFRRKALVTIFQRGAMDGLMAVPSLDDDRLRRLRPRLAQSAAKGAGEAAVLDLDGRFGLHPSLGPLLPYWQEGRLGIVHAMGSPDPTRSHFDAQDYMETGTPGRKSTSSGWLNRVSGLLGHEATPFRSLALTPALPRSLYGDEPAIAVTNLADFQVQLPGASGATAVAGQGFESLYEQTSQSLLRDTATETFEAVEILGRVNLNAYRPAHGARYPKSQLGRSLRQIAMLIKAGVGLEIAFAESRGWDTHVNQGTVTGTFANRASDLAKSIQAFWTDLGSHRDDVLVMTMTEFGRTVRENGSGGTDHGHGSCLFVLGQEVDGGKVHGHFPGLAEGDLFEGRDLPVTTDFRSIFAGVASNHLGIRNDKNLFPGWKGKPLSLFS
ncbi:MAG: DUF1501 domain-containing protein [Deltaproteobacteria bacterium]|nr:DUF1501 domain-containing protein [Deltaproteobacteria bacterium]